MLHVTCKSYVSISRVLTRIPSKTGILAETVKYNFKKYTFFHFIQKMFEKYGDHGGHSRE